MRHLCVLVALSMSLLSEIGCGAASMLEAGLATSGDQAVLTGGGDNTPETDGGAAAPDDPGDSADTASGANESGNVGSSPAALSKLHEDAIETAVNTAEALATAIAAVLPSKDVGAALEGRLPLPRCPLMDATPEFGAIRLSLDYGEGCGTSTYPGMILSGSASGTLFFVNAVDLTLTAIRAQGASMDGNVSGGFISSAGSVTFATRVALTLEHGLQINGQATVVVDESTGVITISEASVTTAGTSEGNLSITFEEAAVKPSANESFRPHSGTATIVLPASSADGEVTTIAIEFTEQTPIDKTVALVVGQ